LNLNDLDKAVNDFSKTVQLSPKYTDAWSNLGAAYLGKNDDEKAFSAFTKAIELDPDHRDARNNRFILDSALKKWDVMIEDGEKLIALEPGNADYFMGLGMAYAITQDIAKAVASWEKAVQIDPSKADALNAMMGSIGK
jgi:cytochrome c-type biogenesis protein CcmH/NrfG